MNRLKTGQINYCLGFMLYKRKYRTESSRLKGYDYRSNGYYFVTICTQDGLHYFGENINHKMVYNRVGYLAIKFWREIPKHFKHVATDAFIVMPNHVHGVIRIHGMNAAVETLQCNISTKTMFSYVSPKKNSLSTIIRSYKSICSKTINRSFPAINFIWQPRFYDEIIKNDVHLYNVRKYIKNNPSNWKNK